MRDLFLILIITVPLLVTLRKPQIGLLVWLWLSVMNPHRESYGWIVSFPILDLVGAFTLLGCALNANKTVRAEWCPSLTWLYVFFIWCNLTAFFGVSWDLAFRPWSEFTKTILLCSLMLLFMNKRHWILAAIAVFTLAILHTGVKGGYYTLMSGGGARVFGPRGTAWGDNNSVSVAMLIVIPLGIAWWQILQRRIFKLGALGAAGLSFLTLLGTHSRGGLVGLAGQAVFLIYRSNKKIPAAIGLVIVLALGVAFMPDKWRYRMESITFNVEEMDASSANRIIQWYYAIDIANERPLFGSGFNSFFYKPYYYRFVAHLDSNRAIHSNYFEVIGEQGWVGFLFYCLLWLSFLWSSEKWSRRAMKRQDLVWAGIMLRGVQIGFAGYAFNGLTVNMAYLDLPFYLLVFSVLMISHVRSHLAEPSDNEEVETVGRWRGRASPGLAPAAIAPRTAR